jgi:hypothetical protein
MDLAFDDMCVWFVLGLNRCDGAIFKFLAAQMIWLLKVYFSSLRWLNNAVGVYLVQVSLLLIGQQGLGHFLKCRIGPCFSLAGGLGKF